MKKLSIVLLIATLSFNSLANRSKPQPRRRNNPPKRTQIKTPARPVANSVIEKSIVKRLDNNFYDLELKSSAKRNANIVNIDVSISRNSSRRIVLDDLANRIVRLTREELKANRATTRTINVTIREGSRQGKGRTLYVRPFNQ